MPSRCVRPAGNRHSCSDTPTAMLSTQRQASAMDARCGRSRVPAARPAPKAARARLRWPPRIPARRPEPTGDRPRRVRCPGDRGLPASRRAAPRWEPRPQHRRCSKPLLGSAIKLEAEPTVLQTASPHQPEWPLTWPNFLERHVIIRACPLCVRTAEDPERLSPRTGTDGPQEPANVFFSVMY